MIILFGAILSTVFMQNQERNVVIIAQRKAAGRRIY